MNPVRKNTRKLGDVVGLSDEEIMLTTIKEARERLKVAVRQIKKCQKEILLLKRKCYCLSKTNVLIKQRTKIPKSNVSTVMNSVSASIIYYYIF